MAPLAAESTSFTLDNMGRFLCNTLQEAVDSAAQTVAGRRDFDVIVIGGGTFGAVVAEHLFVTDATRSRRILVLEAGPFVLPEHVQNMPFIWGGAPDLRVPWVEPPGAQLQRLIFAIGGRSLTWGGWSPELLDAEMAAVAADGAPRCATSFSREASRQIGVKETNDFIYGPLHTALRKQLTPGSRSRATRPASPSRISSIIRRCAIPIPANRRINAALLRDWLGLPATDTTPKPSCANCSNSRRRSPSSPRRCPGFFPTNKFSAVPGLDPCGAAREPPRPTASERWRMRASG